MAYMDIYKDWCSNPYFDSKTREELLAIKDDCSEIEDRFYKELTFGTGGLRGIIGAGINRMNVYVIRKASQGLANYVCAKGGQARGVVIAYDSRRFSPEFAKEAALCFAGNKIKAYLFDSLRPTPELSFAVRELGCIAGVVITASHNPAEYNGYKVYWEDGAQITPPVDKEIIASVNAVTDYTSPRTMSEEEARRSGLLESVGAKLDARYDEEILKLVSNPSLVHERGKELCIVYTPLHGAGNQSVQRILKTLGFTNVHVVKEQEKPDGDFPTVKSPNPENKEAFTLALELAKEVDADVILATDPDADRLGIYAKNYKSGKYQSFSGNMSASLMLEYFLHQKKQKGELPANGAVVSTIVSGNMGRDITLSYGCQYFETLTGFKYIGQMIHKFKEGGSHHFLLGYEESFGFLIGTYARDKDAVIAVASLCEAALYYKTQGICLCTQMENLYKKYGYHHEDLGTVTLKGKEGSEKIQEIMESVRNTPPTHVGGYKVKSFSDYKKDYHKDFETGKECGTGLPKSNVLYFGLSDGAWCCLRPSGTEPKIKFYIGVIGDNFKDAVEKGEELLQAVKKWVV